MFSSWSFASTLTTLWASIYSEGICLKFITTSLMHKPNWNTNHYLNKWCWQDLDFEHVILENALENVVRKFRRHLQIIKPALEMLLQQIEQVCPGIFWKEGSHATIYRFADLIFFLEPRFDHYLSLLANKGLVSCNLSELTLVDNKTYSILHADVVENVDDDDVGVVRLLKTVCILWGCETIGEVA